MTALSHSLWIKVFRISPSDFLFCSDMIIYTVNLTFFLLKVLIRYKFRGKYNKYMRINNLPISGFGDLGVACWPLVPKFAGSNPAEAVGFLGRKNPQHAFIRRGSKAVGPMS